MKILAPLATLAALTLPAVSLAMPPQEPPCPLAAEPLANPDGAGQFGRRVALDGNTALVGAGLASTRVFVRDRGSWNEQAQLVHGNVCADLSISGDVAFVGTPLSDDLGTDAGSVYVFERNGSAWSAPTQLYASDAAAGDTFGISVVVQGDEAFVGSMGHAAGLGKVYRFERIAGAWTEVGAIQAMEPVVGEYFGFSLARSGDTLLVGSRISPTAYAFVRDGGDWVQQAMFTFGKDVPVDGVRVSVSQDTAVLGKKLGGAQVHVRAGGTWSKQAELGVGQLGLDTFGGSVAIDGDTLVVGKGGGLFDTGPAIAVFVRAGETWSLLGRTPSSFVTYPVEGSVALQGDRILFGGGGVSAVPGFAKVYELPPFLAPSVAYRNAGTNPDSYTATPAYVGQSLHLSVDLATTGHAMALVIGFDSPFGLTLGGGQTLLCFDLLGSGGELINTGFHPGPLAEIDLPVPNDLAYAGFTVSTQAIHAFGVAPFALSNAQDIVIGACF